MSSRWRRTVISKLTGNGVWDGVGSIIRAQLHPEEAPPHSSGYFALRSQSPAIDKLDGLQAIWYFGPGMESGVIQASTHAIYWFVSLHSADVTSGPLDVASVMRRCTAESVCNASAI